MHKSRLALVLSRPCVLEHKAQIIVAAVGAAASQPPREEMNSLSGALSYLKGLRDGERRPDRFYLGQLEDFLDASSYPKVAQRHSAQLDSIHTISLPSQALPRTAFLADARRASMSLDFVRDLQTRLFQSFSYEGFDDYAWHTTSDLEMLVGIGEAEMDALKVERGREDALLKASGQSEEIAKRLEKHNRSIGQLEDQLQRYREELAQRRRRADVGGGR